jgi:hypothetical protein
VSQSAAREDLVAPVSNSQPQERRRRPSKPLVPIGKDASLLFATTIKRSKAKQLGHAAVAAQTDARKASASKASREGCKRAAHQRELNKTEELHPRAVLFAQCEHDAYARWRAEQLFGYAWKNQRKVVQA